MIYKTQQVADKIGVSPRTVNSYTNNPAFAEFLTEQALRASGTQARYTEGDVEVLNTIRFYRRTHTDSAIAEILRNGERITEYPPKSMFVETAAPAEYMRAMAQADAEIENLKEEIEKRQQEIEELRKQLMADQREIGKLEAERDVYKRLYEEQLKKNDNSHSDEE